MELSCSLAVFSVCILFGPCSLLGLSGLLGLLDLSGFLGLLSLSGLLRCGFSALSVSLPNASLELNAKRWEDGTTLQTMHSLFSLAAPAHFTRSPLVYE